MNTTKKFSKSQYTKENFYKILRSINVDIKIKINVEKIFILETAHFNSQQFKNCGTPGLLLCYETTNGTKVDLKWKIPYPFDTYKHYNYLGNIYTYAVLDLYDSIMFVIDFLNRHENNIGRWYSTNERLQNYYNSITNKIKSKL